MKIYIGNDHKGVESKNAIVAFLVSNGHEVKNFGTDTTDSVDYPDYAFQVANATVKDNGSMGIVLCASGVGVCIAANKIKGAKCALAFDETVAMMSRKHDNANILALPASYVAVPRLLNMVDVFLKEPFEAGRHVKRVAKLDAAG